MANSLNKITTKSILDATVATADIADDAVTSAKIADDAIVAAGIADNAVVTATINADAVTGAKIADDAIDSEHYTDGSIDTAHIADNQITLAKMAGGTDGQIITYDASGDPVAVGPGTDGQVLTSTGAGSPPAFEAIPASAVTALNNATANELVTVGSTTTELDAEANLTFDGHTLSQTIDANAEGIALTAASNHYPQLKFNANHTGATESVAYILGQWDGTDIASIALATGPDTTNKDDGQMYFYTRPSGGSMTSRMQITSTGHIGIGRTPDSTNVGSILQLEGNDGLAIRRPSQTNSAIIRPLASGDGMRVNIQGDDQKIALGINELESAYKIIKLKDGQHGIISGHYSLTAGGGWGTLMTIPDSFQAKLFIVNNHNAGFSSAMWDINHSASGGDSTEQETLNNAYSPAQPAIQISGSNLQVDVSYDSWGYFNLIVQYGISGVGSIAAGSLG